MAKQGVWGGFIPHLGVVLYPRLAAINRTWTSAYISARRTFQLGVPSAGRMYSLFRQRCPAGRAAG